MKNTFPAEHRKPEPSIIVQEMDNKRAKPKTVTFQPDDDVRSQLEAIERALGSGFKSKFINDALREELPKVIRRRGMALGKAA